MERESINRPLVVCAAGQEGAGDSDDVRLDVAFQMPAVRNLRLAPDCIGDEGIEYIDYRIVRSPKDLCNHVRRILLQHDMGDPDALYAALLDLFIVLENKGFALRRRVLEGARSRLSAQQYRTLSACMNSDQVQCDRLPAPPDSMLAKGLIGSRSLVEAADNENESVRDPLIEAQEYIEYCQVDQARVLLEQAILDQPQRMELHSELLDIYRSTRDRASFLVFWRRLNDVDNPAPDVWEAAADSFVASGSLE
jgi:hypothetical protein